MQFQKQVGWGQKSNQGCDEAADRGGRRGDAAARGGVTLAHDDDHQYYHIDGHHIDNHHIDGDVTVICTSEFIKAQHDHMLSSRRRESYS